MDINTALVTYLLAQATITALVGQRIYPGGIATQRVTKPYIVVEMASSPGEHTQDGASGIGRPHYTVTPYALQYGQAHQIAAAVKAALDSYQGMMGGTGGVYVHSCFYEDQRDEVDTSIEPLVYSVPQEYYIKYREESCR